MGRFSPSVVPDGVNPFAVALQSGVSNLLASQLRTRDQGMQDEQNARTQQMFAAQMKDVAHQQSQWGLQDASAQAAATANGVQTTVGPDGLPTYSVNADATPGARMAREEQYGRTDAANRVIYQNRQLEQEGTIAANRNSTAMAEARIRANTELQTNASRVAAERYTADTHLAGTKYTVDHKYGDPSVDAAANAVAQFNQMHADKKEKYAGDLAYSTMRAAYGQPLPQDATLPDANGKERPVNFNNPQDVRAFRMRQANEVVQNDPTLSALAMKGAIQPRHMAAAAEKYENSPEWTTAGKNSKQQALGAAMSDTTASTASQSAALFGDARNRPTPGVYMHDAATRAAAMQNSPSPNAGTPATGAPVSVPAATVAPGAASRAPAPSTNAPRIPSTSQRAQIQALSAKARAAIAAGHPQKVVMDAFQQDVAAVAGGQ